jgi:hypothetical protein
MSAPATVEVTAVPPALNADDARALTEQIRSGLERVSDLIIRAYTERAWEALKYPCWDDYCNGEFDTARLGIPREDRAETVASLRTAGMSVRAIASATGISRGTVQRELSGVPNGTPQRAPVIPGDVTADTPGITARVEAILQKQQTSARVKDRFAPVITGTDGKTYAPNRPTRAPRRRPLTGDATNLAREWRRFNGKLQKLLEDDRFGRSREGVMEALGSQPAITTELLARLQAAAGEP